MLGWSVTGVRRWMGGEWVTNWRHRFCFLAHPSFLNVHPTPPPLRGHHPTVSDTFQESFKYRRTYHQPRLFSTKNRLKLDYKYTEKDTPRQGFSTGLCESQRRRNPNHQVTTHPFLVSSSTHHRVLGAWWRWGSCSGTPPCVAYSHWCMCYHPSHTEACRCRHTRWDHKSSGHSAVPPDTHHRRDSPCIRLQEKQNNAASLDCTGDNPTLTLPPLQTHHSVTLFCSMCEHLLSLIYSFFSFNVYRDWLGFLVSNCQFCNSMTDWSSQMKALKRYLANIATTKNWSKRSVNLLFFLLC